MEERTYEGPNGEAIEAWNGVLFDKFVRFRHVLTTGLTNQSDAAMARNPPKVGARVLDVGCGFGDTTITLAKKIGPKGSAVGIDAAARFLEVARADAKRDEVSNVRFAAADVQSADLGGPFDYAFSRFGTMFFSSPVAAMKNVRRSVMSGGTLCMLVWRKREDNEWMYVAQKVVRGLIPEEKEKHDQPTCGPGPFSMSGADATSDILQAAGWKNVTLERSDIPIKVGDTVDEAVEIAMSLGPAGEIIRLAGDEGQRVKPQVVEALKVAFAQFVKPAGVWGPSSAWIVTARA
ncbi:MAG: class I SAM-dependent methyltransferase [Polyangiales bacterium]